MIKTDSDSLVSMIEWTGKHSELGVLATIIIELRQQNADLLEQAEVYRGAKEYMDRLYKQNKELIEFLDDIYDVSPHTWYGYSTLMQRIKGE